MSNIQYIHPSLLEGLTIVEDGDDSPIPISGEKLDELGRILFFNDEQESA